jgi:hypothetical protein
MPQGPKMSRISLVVPKYASSGAITCDPGPSAWIIVIVADDPDAKHKPTAPPSSDAIAASSAFRFGFA